MDLEGVEELHEMRIRPLSIDVSIRECRKDRNEVYTWNPFRLVFPH
jgi:hypothetical protein